MILKKGIAALTYSNIWISAGAAAMGWLFYLLMGLPVNYYLLAFLFCSTLSTYTFQRFIKLHQKESIQGPRIIWMKNHPSLVKGLMIIGLAAAVVFMFFLSLRSILVIAVLGMLSFLYAYKMKFFNNRTNLRDLPGIKIYLIAGVWAGSTAFLPALEANLWNATIFLVFSGFFCFILAITIPFDIRDIDVDEEDKKTIPQLVGVNFSKIISLVLLLLSYLLIVGNLELDTGLTTGYSIGISLIIMSQKNHNELFYSFLIDGLLLLVPLCYFFLSRPEFIAN